VPIAYNRCFQTGIEESLKKKYRTLGGTNTKEIHFVIRIELGSNL
jgi:hypothetical protein